MKVVILLPGIEPGEVKPGNAGNLITGFQLKKRGMGSLLLSRR
jgi:hypothetical protein